MATVDGGGSEVLLYGYLKRDDVNVVTYAIAPQYKMAYPFYHGTALVQKTDGSFAIIDVDGYEIVSPTAITLSDAFVHARAAGSTWPQPVLYIAEGYTVTLIFSA